jgi:hypothetical protein
MINPPLRATQLCHDLVEQHDLKQQRWGVGDELGELVAPLGRLDEDNDPGHAPTLAVLEAPELLVDRQLGSHLGAVLRTAVDFQEPCPLAGLTDAGDADLDQGVGL